MGSFAVGIRSVSANQLFNIAPATAACYSAGAYFTLPTSTSLPRIGRDGTLKDSMREIAAIIAPATKTKPGDIGHRKAPNTHGIITAAIWLIEKLTLLVAAMSCGSAIFLR